MDSSIPPWLQVGPRDYLSALHSGLSTGLQIGEAQNRADQLANAQAIRQAESERDAKLRAWEFTQAMAQRAQQTKAQNEAKLAALQAARDYRDSTLDFRRQMEQRRVAAEMAKENKPSFHNVGGNLIRVDPSGEMTKMFTPPAKPVYDTETTVIPKQEAVPATEPISERNTWAKGIPLIGGLYQPPMPGIPEKPEMPERRITKRIPRGATTTPKAQFTFNMKTGRIEPIAEPDQETDTEE